MTATANNTPSRVIGGMAANIFKGSINSSKCNVNAKVVSTPKGNTPGANQNLAVGGAWLNPDLITG